MKKLIIGLALSAISTGALASKARLESLGETGFGSQFIDDSRNVFLNPAHLNKYKDFVTMDWGNTANTADDNFTPREEGGVFKTYKNFVVGVNFGSESDLSNSVRALAQVPEEQNNTDFFVAGNAGVQWGARLTYQSFKNDTNNADESSDVIRLTAGIISGKTEAFLNFGLRGEAERGDNEFQGKGSVDLGVTHKIGNLSLLGRFQTINGEGTSQVTGNEEDFKVQNFGVGAAKMYKLSDKTSAWSSIWYRRDSITNDITKDAPGFESISGDIKNNYIPVTFAIETTINSWLTFRSSVTHEIYGISEDDNGDESTNADTTDVNAGVTLTYGDLELDGMIGSSADVDESNERNVTRVSMTYKF